MATQYDAIYFNQSRVFGQVRMSEDGLGWKASQSAEGNSSVKISEPFLLPANELLSAQWSRGARGYVLSIQTHTNGVVQLDGFEENDFNSLKNALSRNLRLNLEHLEHSLRGWNWGEVNFERDEFVFNVASRPSFEIPYKVVANSNVSGKTEVAVELGLQAAKERTTGGDELVEIRFYVPGVVQQENVDDENSKVKEEEDKIGDEAERIKKEDGEKAFDDAEGFKKEEDEDDEVNELPEALAGVVTLETNASLFHQQLMDRANLGIVTGAEIVAFSDIMFLTPRGRYDMDMFEDSFRLRGKSYDYKIRYNAIQRIFVLPKSDDIHNIVILKLDPPLRQGQTRYPFLVMQFARDEELEVELNVSEDEYQAKYADRLQKSYDEPTFQVVSQMFKGLAARRIIFAGSFVSSHNQPSVSCSLKANEGSLYLLEKAFVFVSKSPVYIPYTDIANVRFSRLGGALSSSRTFDMSITLLNNAEHQFSNIDREEQAGIESYLRAKTVKTKNDIAQDQQLLDASLAGDEEDDDEVMEDGSQDEESEDEDFEADSESDIAEEFDEDAEGNYDSGSDEGSNSDEGDRQRSIAASSKEILRRPPKRVRK